MYIGVYRCIKVYTGGYYDANTSFFDVRPHGASRARIVLGFRKVLDRFLNVLPRSAAGAGKALSAVIGGAIRGPGQNGSTLRGDTCLTNSVGAVRPCAWLNTDPRQTPEKSNMKMHVTVRINRFIQ